MKLQNYLRLLLIEITELMNAKKKTSISFNKKKSSEMLLEQLTSNVNDLGDYYVILILFEKYV